MIRSVHVSNLKHYLLETSLFSFRVSQCVYDIHVPSDSMVPNQIKS